MRPGSRVWLPVLAALLLPQAAPAGEDLVQDPSFETPRERDRFGLVFAHWGGWKCEGDCDFAVGRVARTRKHSCLLVGGTGAKTRAAQNVDVEPGRGPLR